MDQETALRVFAQRVGPTGATEKELKDLGLFQLTRAKSSLKDDIQERETKSWSETDWEAAWTILESS
jgi:hypothetical protein